MKENINTRESQKTHRRDADGADYSDKGFILSQQAIARLAKIGQWRYVEGVLTCDAMLSSILEVPQATQINDVDTFLSYFRDAHKGLFKKAMQQAHQKKKPFELVLEINTAQGKEKWIKICGKPEDGSGEAISVAGIMQAIDIQSELTQNFHEECQACHLQMARRTSELNNLNQELESFTYYVSHDLRAPLRAIMGFAEALDEDEEGLSDDARHYLRRILSNGQKMNDLIDNLLKYSRADNVRKAVFNPVNLNELVGQVIKENFFQHDNLITTGQLPVVKGDKQMLMQLFVNLVGNAIKYSSRADPQKVNIFCEEENNQELIIVIKDNGVGFDMAYVNRLFKAFERLHDDIDFEGTGVGLALCKKIMDIHMGRIWAESKEGCGATFYLAFERYEENGEMENIAGRQKHR